jgi:hypothetical protein
MFVGVMSLMNITIVPVAAGNVALISVGSPMNIGLISVSSLTNLTDKHSLDFFI